MVYHYIVENNCTTREKGDITNEMSCGRLHAHKQLTGHGLHSEMVVNPAMLLDNETCSCSLIILSCMA